MIKFSAALIFSVCLVSALLHATSLSAQEKPAIDPSQLSPEAMAKMMEENAKTVEEHEILQSMVGKWTCECTNVMPDGKKEVFSGQSTYTSLLGGRYVQEEFKATFMGAPFHGIGIMGYDKNQKKFTGVWMDNMSTSMMTSEGQYIDGTKTIASTGEGNCPMGPMTCKMSTQLVSDDEMIFTMKMAMPGGEMQESMKIVYKRVK